MMARPKRFELLTPRFVVWARSLKSLRSVTVSGPSATGITVKKRNKMALCYPKGISAEGEISELHVGLKGTIGDEPVEIEEEVPAKENEPLERIEKNNNSDAPIFEE